MEASRVDSSRESALQYGLGSSVGHMRGDGDDDDRPLKFWGKWVVFMPAGARGHTPALGLGLVFAMINP